jgi:hypothetical protein
VWSNRALPGSDCRSASPSPNRAGLCGGAEENGEGDRRRRGAVEARSLLTGGGGRMRHLELGRAGPGAPQVPVAVASILGLVGGPELRTEGSHALIRTALL